MKFVSPQLFTALGLGLLSLASSAKGAALGDELLQNGKFESKAANADRPSGWSVGAGVKWETDGRNRWITEDAGNQPASFSVNQRVTLGARFWKLRLSCRVRATNVKLGSEGWNDARIAMSFHTADGKMVGGWPNVLHFTGTMPAWETHQRDFTVPEGAAYLDLSCSLFSATGKVEWDDVSLKLLKFTPVMEDAALSEGVQARWDLAGAMREETPTRGRVCINGLWKFHPVDLKERALPAAGTGWGYLKVPGTWAPGTSRTRPLLADFMEARLDLGRIDAAWYQRTITIPSEWRNRRILIDLDNPKQTARVLVDGHEAGSIDWPGGRVDLTHWVKPGATHTLSIYTLALPIEEKQLVVMGPTQIEQARTEVRFKGLCGDCFLVSEPPGSRITDVFVKPSVRRGELTVQCEVSDAGAASSLRLEAVVSEGGKVVKQFTGAAPAVTGRWPDAKLWDLDQPNLYQLSVRLLDAGGKLLDETTPVTFGFREFWIQGRDFILNGKRLHLRALHCGNMNDFANAAYPQVKSSFARARHLGFNYVIHGCYDYEVQSYAYMDDVLRAGDETGFPMSYSIRHVKQIYRDFENPEKRRFWNRVVDYEVKRVRNHPAILMWAMNHNFTGWADDQNPGRLDGVFAPKPDDDKGLAQRRHAATLAEQYVMALDGTRPAYHHQSGSFNQMITLNCYLNWTPLQERIEWLSQWANAGMKPLFFVEFGLPHQASWGGHRTGPFIWRNKVNSEPLAAEFSAIYAGDRAYDLTEDEVKHVDTIERVYARREPFHINQVLGAYWDRRWEHNFLELKSLFTAQTWPAFRTWGLTAILPWDQADLFKQTSNANPQAMELPTDWARLQRPGVAPDFIPWSADWLVSPRFEDNLEATSLGQTFRRVNGDTLAWIAGPPARFTARDHLFSPGETVAKQAILINDLREPARATWEWAMELGGKVIAQGKDATTIPPGDQHRAPISFKLPGVSADTKGVITLRAAINGKSDESLTDRFEFNVLAPTVVPKQQASIAAYDPKGQTLKLLRQPGLKLISVEKPVAPPDCKLFVVGREAITLDGPGLDVEAITRAGANVLIFEQTEEVLQKRWGFRTASPGARRVFVRQPDHPALRGLTDELLRDWRGASTLLDPYPKEEGFIKGYHKQEWCGFNNTRTWQWGNYGTVASVLIEKPQRGNWSCVLDCEFDLQYAPLLEWFPGSGGRVVFSQMDFAGRDGAEPAAQRLLLNLLAYAQTPSRERLAGVRVLGGPNEQQWLRELGVESAGGDVVIVAPGANPIEARASAEQAKTIICLGLRGNVLTQILPFAVQTEERPVTHTSIGRPTGGALAGLGDAEFHWRGKLQVPAISRSPAALRVLPTGVLAEGTLDGKRYVFVQFLPAQFDGKDKPYLRLSQRRASIALARILTNCGVRIASPVVDRLRAAGPGGGNEPGRWLQSYYLDEPTTLDDPYRYERW